MNLKQPKIELTTHCSRCGDAVELTAYAASLGKRDVMCRACMRMPSVPKMTPQLYAEYLQTNHWKTFKANILKKRGKRCQVCGRAGYVSLHHNDYSRLGGEHESDVIVLCESDGSHYGCHQIFHDNGRLAY